ncbi:DUF6461 domain-containing protein [Streptosporangium roseum]|uniref:Uncharacterized protein n=1 Tax=Streptosporangium roseum (strain ATCC 12428 / DSM 43021 / JCM 3005 / KCTC 9067 / NCIMB 10171 / NRRL 2505 / NI 9100) TaxID=479432 RepID=D2BA30_STRRD|nr:DUF6461 domain-containing protein [Streptosporangium roseum]ACZ86043.1 hypothetical protein Sros_3095 [Streptosporangium roseum DSM 43021]
MIDETRHRYADFLQRNPYVAQATCWIVVQPVTAPLSVETIAERLGGRAEDLEYEPDDDVDEADYEGAFYISQDGASFVVFEDNGYQGTRPEVLRQLSDSARVVSLFWNVNANTMLHYAVYGTVVTALDPMFPGRRWGKDPHALDAELAVLDEDHGPGGWRAGAMAVVEAVTGVRLDLPDAGAPRLLLEETLPEDPHPPSTLGQVDPDLDVRLRLAPEPVQAKVVRHVVAVCVEATGLADESLVRDALDRLVTGHSAEQAAADLRPLLARLMDDRRDAEGEVLPNDHPVSCRHWAARALETALRGHRWSDRLDALVNAPTILGETWPPLRSRLKAMIAEAGG